MQFDLHLWVWFKSTLTLNWKKLKGIPAKQLKTYQQKDDVS